MKTIKIRFNTLSKETHTPAWRVIIDGVEHLVDEVEINTKSWTTKDWSDIWGWRWNLTCESDNIILNDTIKCIIN
jgi:hypothetical protein